MCEVEPDAYLRLSGPGAAYAFHTYPSGVALLNISWLTEIIQQYEAGTRRLTDLTAEPDRLELVRRVAQQVDDDRLAWSLRSHQPVRLSN